MQLYYAVIALLLIPWVLSFVPAYKVYDDFGHDRHFLGAGSIARQIVNGSIDRNLSAAGHLCRPAGTLHRGQLALMVPEGN